jgi:hypothetical protein
MCDTSSLDQCVSTLHDLITELQAQKQVHILRKRDAPTDEDSHRTFHLARRRRVYEFCGGVHTAIQAARRVNAKQERTLMKQSIEQNDVLNVMDRVMVLAHIAQAQLLRHITGLKSSEQTEQPTRPL